MSNSFYTPGPPRLNRRSFLRQSIKAFAATSLVLGGGGALQNCGGTGGPVPSLVGLSAQEYHNMNALAEVFLGELPFAFDLGKATDDYAYGHATPLDTVDIVHELAGAPSSWLAAMLLDFSPTTLVALPVKEREARMLGWLNSGSVMKRGLYNIMKQTCFFLLSSSPEYLKLAGYNINNGFTPYRYRPPA